MARHILEDEKYSKGPVVFESYKEMVDKVRAMCSKKGLKFSEKDEKSLKYKVEVLLE